MKKSKSASVQNRSNAENMSRSVLIIGLGIFIVLILFAIGSNPNFDFFGQRLGDLSVGASSEAYQLALVSAAIVLIIFYAAHFSDSTLSKIWSSVGVISAIALFLTRGLPFSSQFEYGIMGFIFFFLTAVVIFLSDIDNYRTGKKDFICLGEVMISLAILFYILIENTPFVQKVAIAMIIAWVLMSVAEDNVGLFRTWLLKNLFKGS